MSAESWMQLSSKVIKLTKDGSKVLLVLYFGRTLDSADSVSSAAFFFFFFLLLLLSEPLGPPQRRGRLKTE